jgi:DnaK suppressor protein
MGRSSAPVYDTDAILPSRSWALRQHGVACNILPHRELTVLRASVTNAGLSRAGVGARAPEAMGLNEGTVLGGRRLNQKDAKRFKKMLDESKRALLVNARKTLMEESNFDTDDLPDEIDLASSEYSQSMIFRLRDREKFLLKKIDKALQRIETGNFGICERCEDEISIKRLEARPVTTLCIRCKEEQEKKEKSYG